MEIIALGTGGIKVSGTQSTILCDPPTDSAKSKLPADVILISSPEALHQAASLGTGQAGMIVDGPGEYEIKEALITGIPARLHVDSEGWRGTMYLIELDATRLAFVGNIAPGLSDEQLEQLGEVDILVVPVGGHGLTLDAAAAAQIVSQVEPKYVIPTHYNDGKSKYAVGQDDLSKFTSEVGSNPEPVSKLKVNPKEMPLETTVVVLEV